MDGALTPGRAALRLSFGKIAGGSILPHSRSVDECPKLPPLSGPARNRHVSTVLRRKLIRKAVIVAAACIQAAAASRGDLAEDAIFQPPFFANVGPPARVLSLPDGKYLVYLGIDTLAGQPTGPVVRFRNDGTLDSSFAFSRDYTFVGAATAVPGPAGAPTKLLISVGRSVYGAGDATEQVLLLNSDGSIDTSFNSGAVANGSIRAITVTPGGKILVTGFFTQFAGANRNGIARLLPNGDVDSAFALVSTQGSSMAAGVWADPVVQTDGRIVIAGDFTEVDSVACTGVARLNDDGTLDNSFDASGFNIPAGRRIRGVVVQGDGKIVLGGKFRVGLATAALVRLNANGSLDSGFTLAGANLPQIADLIAQPDGKLLAAADSIYRFNVDGSPDVSFHNPALLINRSPPGSALSINLESDGHILIGGSFTDVDDATGPSNGLRLGVARLNADGTLAGLTSSQKTGSNAVTSSFVRLTDSSTLIAFDTVDPTTNAPVIPHNFGRLKPDGSIDATFDPFANLTAPTAFSANFVVRGFERLGNGGILVFGTKGPSGAFAYGKLLANGVEDKTFVPDAAVNSFDRVYSQPDGSVLVSSFVNVQTRFNDTQSVVNNRQLLRLRPDGALDPGFQLDPRMLSDTTQRELGTITLVAVGSKVVTTFADGRILYSYLGTDNRWRLVRLAPSGSFDDSFTPASTLAQTIVASDTVVDPETNGNRTTDVLLPSNFAFADAVTAEGGKHIVVGTFTSFGNVAARGIVRINANGSVDPTFQSGGGPQWTSTAETAGFFPGVDNIARQADGQLLITGTFEAFDGIPSPGVASLDPDGLVDSTFDAPVLRQKFSAFPAVLRRQTDASCLLSGPYTASNHDVTPSFIRLLGPPAIVSPRTAGARFGRLFVYQFETRGATSLDVGNLPAGLAFIPSLSAIVGRPTESGLFQIDLSASNDQGTTTQTLSLFAQPDPSSGPIITSSTSASGEVGARFRFQVITQGASSAARLSATGLPAGLTLDSVAGLIRGVPTLEGSFAVDLTVTDGGFTTTGTLQLTFTDDPAIPVIESPTEAAITAGQPFSYTIDAPAEAGPDDPTIFTLVGTLPNGLGFDAFTGTIAGNFTGTTRRSHSAPGATTLSGGVVTNVQIFATNSHGTSTVPLVFYIAPTGVVNISTRISVKTGDNVLIGGFIVTGNAPKRVIVRAIGPSLTAGGMAVPGTLQDPTLELHQGDGALLGANDDWGSSQEEEIVDTTVAPSDPRESAIIATLEPGNYTAIVAGKDAATGIALVEVYDLGTASLDTSSAAQLANISTRGFVQTADDVMIGGFIISGATSKVIVRAIGPELTARGVAGALADTTLELRDGVGSLISANDDWKQGSQEQQIIDSTVPPADDRESAIVATLTPGAYTAIVRGKEQTTGVGLVEVYVLQ